MRHGAVWNAKYLEPHLDKIERQVEREFSGYFDESLMR
jgi:hypothetical protein